MQLFCGTSGFSYKEWKGSFYPPKLPASRMLAFYCTRLPAVEINNTFYRMPKQSALEGWREAVPETFRFAIKAPRRISHSKRLADCGEEAAYLFGAAAKLGKRLGAVLVQLPPHLRADPARLERFLALVPAGLPVAFEFRHPSWHDEAVFASLKAHSAAWVNVDTDGAAPSAPLPATAPWTYLRLRAPGYEAATLRAWHDACAPFEHAFVFFKHEAAGTAPALAEQMQRLQGPAGPPAI